MVINGRRFRLEHRRVAQAMAKATPEPIHEHFVVIGGRRYPPKQVIDHVTGLDRADFTTHQARRILSRLGFQAARLSSAAAARGQLDEDTGDEQGSAERLRPFIGQWVALKDDEVLVGAREPGDVVAWLAEYGKQADTIFRVPEGEEAVGGSGPW